jgi:hypothetical protein
VTLADKRKEIRNLTLETIKNKKDSASRHFHSSYKKMKTEMLFEETTLIHASGWRVTELFDLRQGVTWGGEGCAPIFVVNKSVASQLEEELTPRTIGGRDIQRGKIVWGDENLVFPYLLQQQKWVPAFQIPSLGEVDSLDFDISIGESEKGQSPEFKLKVRTGRKIIPFPKVAEYLFKYYDILSRRVFKEKPLSAYKKMWYEYIWQRDPSLCSKSKIVCRRLTPEARFALDDVGYLPRDSVISLLPKGQFNTLKATIGRVVNKTISNKNTLEYVLAFLNSKAVDDLLVSQRAKKQGGYPMVGEKILKRFIIPKPEPKHASRVEAIISGKFEEEDIDCFYR